MNVNGAPIRQPGTVYVVDDDPIALMVLERILTTAGYGVQTFESPTAFLDVSPSAGPCCVVLDLRMPAIDGIEVVGEMSRRALAIPVVFISGKADVPSVIRAMKTGPFDFLCKPVDRADLLCAVRGALERDLAARVQRTALSARYATLCPQEQRVICLVAKGLLNKQIVDQVGLSEASVRNYRNRATQKLGVSSVPDLVRLLDLISAG